MHMPCFHAFYTLLKQFWFFCLKFSYSLLVGSFLPPIQKFTTLPSIFAYTMLQFSHPLPDGGFARSSATSWQPLLLNCSWWFRPRQLCIQSIQANARFMSDAIYILQCTTTACKVHVWCKIHVCFNIHITVQRAITKVHIFSHGSKGNSSYEIWLTKVSFHCNASHVGALFLDDGTSDFDFRILCVTRDFVSVRTSVFCDLQRRG